MRSAGFLNDWPNSEPCGENRPCLHFIRALIGCTNPNRGVRQTRTRAPVCRTVSWRAAKFQNRRRPLKRPRTPKATFRERRSEHANTTLTVRRHPHIASLVAQPNVGRRLESRWRKNGARSVWKSAEKKVDGCCSLFAANAKLRSTRLPTVNSE